MEKRKQYIPGLREMADFLESHPEVICPCTNELTIFGASKEQIEIGARAFGKADKVYLSEHFQLRKPFGMGAWHIEFWSPREVVCERVVVDTEEVDEQVFPEQVIPAHTKEIVEWRCSPILATEGGS